jgi:oligopeptide/dipeptide ABC transporter ATP-binding protein
MSEDLVLSVSNLSTEYRIAGGAVRAVRDVSLTVHRNEKLAIVGESGCGKSALALSLIDLVPSPGVVVAGSVVLNGRELRTLSRSQWNDVRGREISLIYQDPLSALDPVRSIGRQITDAIRVHESGLSRRAARGRALSLLRDVEVPMAERRLDDYPHQYSGGMRQRVMIAIALANNPAVVIADEPTTALDVTTQAQIFALLDRLVEERGSAVVLITHNLGLVAGFCTSANVMYAGRIVEHAPVDQLFASPEHPYTRALLDAVPRPDRAQRGELSTIPGQPPDLAHLPVGCAFWQRCAAAGNRADCRATDPAVVEFAGASRSVACHPAAERIDRQSKAETDG